MTMSRRSGPSRRATWQEQFVAMLPEIERLLRIAFRNLTSEARADACADGVIHCMLSYIRLFEQGRAETATPSTLTWFAMLQVRRGRLAGCPMNSKEPLSRYAQLNKGIKVVWPHHRDPSDETWINDIVDSRQISIADQVATKLDICAWLTSLCRRTRCIAADLAKGFTTSDVARKYSLSAGRIAQMRRELNASWQQFQGEPKYAAVG